MILLSLCFLLFSDVGFEIPKEWSRMGKTENLKLEQIQNTSSEFNSVLQEFKSTLGRNPTIIKVCLQ